MDSLHGVLRSIRGETKGRRDHVDVFREFLAQLDRIGRKSGKTKSTRGGKRGARRRSGKR
jgi:hypothetical protein